jgi:predicted porin
MKICFTWLLAAILAIGTTVPAFAAAEPELILGWLTGNDDLTFQASGKETGGDSTKRIDEIQELSGMLLAVKYPFGRWNCGLEYGWGKDKDYAGAKQDFELLSFTVGYRWLEQRRFYLTPYLGWLNLDLGSVAYSGASLGLSAHYDLTARISLDAACGYLLKPDLTYSGQAYDDPSIWDYRLQITYPLNDRVNLGLSYRAYQYNGRFSEYTDSDNYLNGNLDGCTDFLILSVTYQFTPGEGNTTQAQKVAETPEPRETREVKQVNWVDIVVTAEKPQMEMGIRK